MIPFDLNSAAAEATIGALVVVVISGLLYWLGVIRPIKANAEWWATTHEKLGPVVVVDAILTSRTRNTKTVFAAALAKDPGWPRRLRARLHAPELTPFYVPSRVPKDYSPSIPVGGLAVAGRGEAQFKDQIQGTALPYGGKARLWIQAGKRNFYFKLRKRKT